MQPLTNKMVLREALLKLHQALGDVKVIDLPDISVDLDKAKVVGIGIEFGSEVRFWSCKYFSERFIEPTMGLLASKIKEELHGAPLLSYPLEGECEELDGVFLRLREAKSIENDKEGLFFELGLVPVTPPVEAVA